MVKIYYKTPSSSLWNVVVIVAWDDGYKSPEEGVL
jgi:hypothetical protein